MKPFNNFLYVMITGASITGFLGGWAALAHSLKPVQPSSQQQPQQQVLQPLAPLPPIGVASSGNDQAPLQTFIPVPSTRGFSRGFMSGGS